MLYQELLSAKTIMNVGAVYEERTKGKPIGKDEIVEMAFCGRKADGTISPIEGQIHRMVHSLKEVDSLLLASALIKVPNHICVKKEDVVEYKEMLKKHIPQKFTEEGDWEYEQISYEFIMALGYADNDDIIRMQCDIFSDKLPRILQYVIYGKVYKALSEEVSFYKEGELVTDCQNEGALKKKYKKICKKYSDKKLDADLTPVEDVIADFRPYVKAVPYYQGIKPEFLCRMLNVMLRLGNGDKKKCKFVDAFGGSGTISMNIDGSLGLEQTYNDLGILNHAFFQSIQNEEELEKLVKKFIELVINHTGDEEKAGDFFNPYEKILKSELNNGESTTSKYNFAGKLSDIEEAYCNEYGKSEELTKRLEEGETKYGKIMEVVLKNPDEAKDKFREIEKFLHPMMLKIGKLFKTMKEQELELKPEEQAFIFFMYNSLSSRHFYNDATIDVFARFVGSYEKYIRDCKRIFKNINIENKDALNLIDERKDEEDIIWYCDIPYTETSNADYCAEWFDEVGFVERLSECRGNYIVASRFNICEGGRKGLYTFVEKKEEKNSAKDGKRNGIIRFFSRFVTEEFAERYKEYFSYDSTKMKKKEGADKFPNKEWNHITEEKKARYVVFAYSRMEAAGINLKPENRHEVPLSQKRGQFWRRN